MKNYKIALAAGLFAMSLSAPVWADGLTIVVGTAPPPLRVEKIPVAPGPADAYAWHAGHWHWIDEQQVWVPGHWVKRPYAHAEWVQPQWIHGPDGYHFQEGRWEHPQAHEEHTDHKGQRDHGAPGPGDHEDHR